MEVHSAEKKAEGGGAWIKLLQRLLDLHKNKTAAVESVKKSMQADEQIKEILASEDTSLMAPIKSSNTSDKYSHIKQLCKQIEAQNTLLKTLTEFVFDIAIDSELDREAIELQRVTSELVLFGLTSDSIDICTLSENDQEPVFTKRSPSRRSSESTATK